jgi:dTMP kinase
MLLHYASIFSTTFSTVNRRFASVASLRSPIERGSFSSPDGFLPQTTMAATANTSNAASPSAAPASRGALIVLEGVDRSGKSTQCQKLVDYLNSTDRPAALMRFPDRTTTIGTMINSYLSNATDIDDGCIHLLFSANRWEKKKEMERRLLEGTTLILDRYAFSGVAFTAAKGVKGMDRAWCRACDVGLLAPDAVLFLSLSAEEQERRGDFGEERYEKREFQARVREEFDGLKGDYEGRWETINASGTMDEVFEGLKGRVDAIVGEGKGPLGHLW